MPLKAFKTSKSWEEPYDTDSGRAIRKTYIAELNPADFEAAPSTIRAMAVTAGLPVPFVTTYDGLICKSVNGRRDESKQDAVYYTATFDSRFSMTPEQLQRQDDPNPVNWKPITRVIINKTEVPLELDLDGQAVTNSAGVRILERLMAPDVDIAFEITCNATSVPSWYEGLFKPDLTTNTAAIKVIVIPARSGLGVSQVDYSVPAKAARYIPGPFEMAVFNSYHYLKISFTLEISKTRRFRKNAVAASITTHSEWDDMYGYLDCGFMRKEGTDLKKILLPNNEEPREELLLNGAGGYNEAAQDPDDAVYLVRKFHEPADYTVLPNVIAG